MYRLPQPLPGARFESKSLSKMLRQLQNEMFTFEIDRKCSSRLYTGTLKTPFFMTVRGPPAPGQLAGPSDSIPSGQRKNGRARRRPGKPAKLLNSVLSLFSRGGRAWPSARASREAARRRHQQTGPGVYLDGIPTHMNSYIDY